MYTKEGHPTEGLNLIERNTAYGLSLQNKEKEEIDDEDKDDVVVDKEVYLISLPSHPISLSPSLSEEENEIMKDFLEQELGDEMKESEVEILKNHLLTSDDRIHPIISLPSHPSFFHIFVVFIGFDLFFNRGEVGESVCFFLHKLLWLTHCESYPHYGN